MSASVPELEPQVVASRLPTVEQVEKELEHEHYKRRYGEVVRNIVYTLIILAAAAILVATLWLPVLQLYGNEMSPTLVDGDVAAAIKTSNLERGDVVAFYCNNKILVKRVIALGGDVVDIASNGTVTVNGERLDEPYVHVAGRGTCDISLPYQVPEDRLFVMGDNRPTSIDSRCEAVGCVAEEQIVGKVVFRVWPFERLGAVE